MRQDAWSQGRVLCFKLQKPVGATEETWASLKVGHKEKSRLSFRVGPAGRCQLLRGEALVAH